MHFHRTGPTTFGRLCKWTFIVLAAIAVLAFVVRFPDGFMLLELPFHLLVWGLSPSSEPAVLSDEHRPLPPTTVRTTTLHTASVSRPAGSLLAAVPGAKPLGGDDFVVLSSRTRLDRARCGICGEGFSETPVFCRRCGAPHHRDCAEWTGRCSVYGCGGRLSPRADRG